MSIDDIFCKRVKCGMSQFANTIILAFVSCKLSLFPIYHMPLVCIKYCYSTYFLMIFNRFWSKNLWYLQFSKNKFLSQTSSLIVILYKTRHGWLFFHQQNTYQRVAHIFLNTFLTQIQIFFVFYSFLLSLCIVPSLKNSIASANPCAPIREYPPGCLLSRRCEESGHDSSPISCVRPPMPTYALLQKGRPDSWSSQAYSSVISCSTDGSSVAIHSDLQ